MGCPSVPLVLSVLTSALLLEHIPSITAQIRCYKCIVATPVVGYGNETFRMCRDFDYSEKFIVDCPYSTFCMKKFVSAKIPHLINGTERDCANQKQKRHKYQNKMWQVEYTIENPYAEGCEKLDDKGARTTTTEYCYCKGDLCNSTSALRGSVSLHILTAVIVLFYGPLICNLL